MYSIGIFISFLLILNRGVVSNQTLFNAASVYTVDHIGPFLDLGAVVGDDMMQMIGYQPFNDTLPIWTTSVHLEHLSESDISGYIALEYEFVHSPTESQESGHLDLCDSVVPDMLRFTNFDGHLHNIIFESFRMNNATLSTDIGVVHRVYESGIWINRIHLCLDHEDGDENQHGVIMSITTSTLINPLGYLGGEYLMAFPVLIILSLLWAWYCIVWICCMLKYPQSVIPQIHWMIGIVIVFATMDNMVHFLLLKGCNRDGIPSHGMVLIESFLSMMLPLQFRMVMAIISSGIGIVVPKLDNKFIIVSCGYSMIFVVVHGLQKMTEIHLNLMMMQFHIEYATTIKSYIMMTAMAGFLDVFYGVMLLYNAMGIIHRLRLKGQSMKCNVYLGFIRITVCALLIYVVLLLCNVVMVLRESVVDSAHWIEYWMLKEGMWRIMHFVAALGIGYIVRPQRDSLKYLHFMEIPMAGNVAGDASIGLVTDDVTTFDVDDEDMSIPGMYPIIESDYATMESERVESGIVSDDGHVQPQEVYAAPIFVV